MEIEKHSDSSFSERHAAWKGTFCESGYMFMRAEERGTPPARARAFAGAGVAVFAAIWGPICQITRLIEGDRPPSGTRKITSFSAPPLPPKSGNFRRRVRM